MKLEGKRVLVTGGAGFIGSELTRQLAQGKADVTVVDSLVNGKRENLDGIIGNSVRLEVFDIRADDKMRQLFRDQDIIFHLACLGVRHSIHSPKENHEVNASATLGLLSVARELGVERFVYVSTSEVYGCVDPNPPMTTKHHTQPMTVYGASKLAGESYARAFYRTYGYPTVMVRPFNAYGPRCHHQGDSGEAIPRFMLRCMADRPLIIFGDGTQTRDYSHVSDTARGILMAGFSEAAVGKTINLGSGTEITINELVQLVADVVGKPQPNIIHDEARPGDVYRLLADVTEAKEVLGYSSEIGLREGLESLKAWYVGSNKKPEELLNEEIVRNWTLAVP